MLAFEERKEFEVGRGVQGVPLSGYRVTTYIDGEPDQVIKSNFIGQLLISIIELQRHGYVPKQ